ncbi:acetylxylan esterase [Pseudolysinimonas sp.]|uniref:acetylxylan esterase n=1 Tax=Pseudolysinimonas sp. TaxID=2680009 RepID=UPI003F81862F
MNTDLDAEALLDYRSSQTAPDDFDDFWAETLGRARSTATATRVVPVDAGLVTLDVADVTFSGFDGQPVRAWLRRPRGGGRLPLVVQYVGYGGGRGLPTENLLWASAGYAHLQVDVRGQGSMWSVGDTPDDAPSGPQSPGFMTRGIGSPATSYLVRLITDAVRGLDAALELPDIDPDRVAVLGTSQGGGLSIAVAGLHAGVGRMFAHVPFLCDFPRAVRIHDADPYAEIVRYLAAHRDHVDRVMETLRYVDGVNFARRATAPAWFGAALMDETCKPSTVAGAFHAYAGEKELELFPFNGHEGGGPFADAGILRRLAA